MANSTKSKDQGQFGNQISIKIQTEPEKILKDNDGLVRTECTSVRASQSHTTTLIARVGLAYSFDRIEIALRSNSTCGSNQT